MIHAEGGGQALQLYSNKAAEVIYSVSRGELNKTLMNAAAAAGVDIRFGHRCEQLDLVRRELVLVDDSSAGRLERPYEVLVGADGSGSVVREALAGATDVEVSEQILGHGYKELTIPAGTGGAFAMDKEALHIWPRAATC